MYLLLRYRTAQPRALLAAVFLAATLVAGAQTKTTSVKDATADIVEARALAYEMVHIAQDFPKDGPDYNKARVAYAFAQSSFTGWGAYVGAAIRDGSARTLNTDASYTTRTNTAKQKLTDFTGFVESTSTGASRGADVGSLVVEIGKAAVDLWFTYKDKSVSARGAAATEFQSETKWLGWDELAAKPSVAPSPANPVENPAPSSTQAPPAKKKPSL